MLRDGFHQHAVHGGVAPYRPNSLDGGCPFLAGGAERRRVRRRAGARRRVGQDPRGTGVVRRPLQPGPPVLAEHDAAGEGAHRARRTPSSWPSATSRRSRSASCWRWPTSTRSCARRSRPGWACRPRSRPRPLVDLEPSPALSQLGGTGRPTAAWSASSSTPTATWTASTGPAAGLGGRHGPAGDRPARRQAARRHRPCSAPSPRPGPSSSTRSCWPAVRRRRPTRSCVRDSKAGEDGAPALDPRVALLLQECFRHAKAIGAWGAGREALELGGRTRRARSRQRRPSRRPCSPTCTRRSRPTGSGSASRRC